MVFMFYKPKFCCECGEKIERVEWNLLTSRKFCEDCEKPLESHSRYRKLGGAAVALLVGIFVTTLTLFPTKQTVVVQSKQLAPAASPSANQAGAKTQVSPAANVAVIQTAPITQTVQPQTLQTLAASPQTAPQAAAQTAGAAYYCGARTQKGTLCTRRVRGAGRCWQHTGKPAMVAQEKLLMR